jgi:hypothetical protein
VQRLKVAVIGAAVAALSITALGAPVAAADTKGDFAFVNGIPGVKVDVCYKGKEVVSGLRYGKVAFRKVPKGVKAFKFFKKDPRTCKGKLLARSLAHDVKPDTDRTLVVTKVAPKVHSFDNVGLLGGTTGTAGPIVVRHAAELGDVRFLVDVSPVEPKPVDVDLASTSAVGNVFSEGDQGIEGIVLGPPFRFVALLEVARPDGRVFRGPVIRYLPDYKRLEWILVGTKEKNARIVGFKRPSSG